MCPRATPAIEHIAIWIIARSIKALLLRTRRMKRDKTLERTTWANVPGGDKKTNDAPIRTGIAYMPAPKSSIIFCLIAR